ncbi:GNAT family N-acetyltransferase [Persicitalea sp.]|uniref:GNAT family N-acetyltransferase n=1 Tax=Persicitalea sp. TaxID=3100273 RepID=UPI003593BF4B
MQTLIRPAQPTDATALYQMLCELENERMNREAFDEVFLTNLVNRNVLYLIAESAGQPVGMASCHVQLLLHHAAPIAEIQEMYIDPSARSQGIGKRFIKAILEFAFTCGATQIEVTSNLTRHDTHRFYEREGFQKTHAKLVLKTVSR